jgi:hypothetical protein
MWIALTVLGVLALLVTVIWLLPVRVIIRNDDENNLILLYKFLFKTYGENPDPNDPIVKTLKKAGGVDKLEKQALQKNIRQEGLKNALSDTYKTIVDLLKEILELLRFSVATRLRIQIRCTGSDPAEAAIHYGQSCAATNIFLNVFGGLVKIRRRGCHIDISCDLEGSEPIFRYDVILTFRFGRVLAAFWRVAMEEVKREEAKKAQRK